VPKLAHRADLLKAGDSTEVLAVVCMLLLRGPQTAAELRARTERMAKFTSNEEVAAILEKLVSHPDGPFVARLSRGRYQHLYSGDAPPSVASAPGAAPAASQAGASASSERLAALEARVAALEELTSTLKATVHREPTRWA